MLLGSGEGKCLWRDRTTRPGCTTVPCADALWHPLSAVRALKGTACALKLIISSSLMRTVATAPLPLWQAGGIARGVAFVRSRCAASHRAQSYRHRVERNDARRARSQLVTDEDNRGGLSSQPRVAADEPRFLPARPPPGRERAPCRSLPNFDGAQERLVFMQNAVNKDC
ncbi:hypothetical protein AAFF_G00269070 [Aldrovandia affinis]|uniref:Uncharacterized protein n=1 Tax=Aldrovandia affinis TaxID=143900 RepID=A0AAD7WSY6_9TELE|nr:hypothetical protein AAFF_G00269070 [Aldrovandia affinis]